MEAKHGSKKHASKHEYGCFNIYTKLFYCFGGNVSNITVTHKRPHRQRDNMLFHFLYNVVSENQSVHLFIYLFYFILFYFIFYLFIFFFFQFEF